MGYKILLPQDIVEEGKQYLLEHGYELKLGSGISEEILKKEVSDCDAILVRTAPITGQILKAGKKLKVVAKHGVGVDNIDVKTATELGIYVTNAPLSNANSVAEHAMGLIIACAKNLITSDRAVRNGNFAIRNQLMNCDLEEKTLGIIGLGRIGSIVGKKAINGFNMKVIGFDPYVTKSKLPPEIEVVNSWEYIFENADFICVHLPATIETRGIICNNEFRMMKPTAFLINVSRGGVVNEADLIEALTTKQIAGAGLDVFAEEPPSQENPLFKMDQVIVTPHNAALTKEAKIRMAVHAAKSIDEVLTGLKPSWPVNNPLIVEDVSLG